MSALLSPQLVGRAPETAALRGAVEAVRRREGAALALLGEPGIGKSRLRRHAEDLARDLGLRVLSGRAVEGGSSVAFRALAEALSNGFRDQGVPRDPAVTVSLPTLAHLVPEWSSRPAPHTSVVAIAEAVLRLLEATARETGALLVIEDVHWADQDTLAVLEYLLDNAGAHGAGCLLTLRPEPPEAARTVRGLADRRAVHVVELDALGDGESDAMVRACLGQDAVSAELLGFVRKWSDGNPFFVEELLAGLVRSGQLVQEEGQWRTSGALAATVPVTFAESVAERLGSLPAQARTVVGAAALFGRDVRWDLLTGTTGLDEPEVLEALSAAAEARLLVSEEGVLRFRHALTREGVRERMLPPERAALARRALELVPQTEDPELIAELSLLAGDTARAGRALVTAAGLARDRGALATAAARLEHAASLQGADAGLELSVREHLAEVRALSGDVDAALELAGPALAARRARADAPGRVIDVELALARALLAAGSYDRAQQHTDRAAEAAGGAGDRERERHSAVLAAQIAVSRGELAAAERLAAGVLGDGVPDGAADGVPGGVPGTPTGDGVAPEDRCEALEVVGRCRRIHDVAAAERAFEQALEVAERYGLSLWRARALHELGTIDLLDSMSTERLAAARRAAAEAGAPALVAVVDFHLASAFAGRNNLADARAAAERAVALAERLGLSVLPAALTVLGRVHAHQLDRAGVERIAARVREVAPGDPAVEAGLHSHVFAMLHMHAADRTAARVALDASARLLRDCPGHHDPFRGLWALLCTVEAGTAQETAQGTDADAGAAERAEAAAAAGSDTRYNRALLRAAEAVALGRAGRTDVAAETYDAAVAELRGYLQSEYMVHMTGWLVAPAARADGWGDPAGLLQSAVRWFGDHEYDALATSCRRLLKEYGESVPRAGRGSSLVPEELRELGVTSRETDVLRLIVAGRTNREIAEQLVLSGKTVEKHAASLLAKTGSTDRRELRRRFARLLGAETA